MSLKDKLSDLEAKIFGSPKEDPVTAYNYRVEEVTVVQHVSDRLLHIDPYKTCEAVTVSARDAAKNDYPDAVIGHRSQYRTIDDPVSIEQCVTVTFPAIRHVRDEHRDRAQQFLDKHIPPYPVLTINSPAEQPRAPSLTELQERQTLAQTAQQIAQEVYLKTLSMDQAREAFSSAFDNGRRRIEQERYMRDMITSDPYLYADRVSQEIQMRAAKEQARRDVEWAREQYYRYLTTPPINPQIQQPGNLPPVTNTRVGDMGPMGYGPLAPLPPTQFPTAIPSYSPPTGGPYSGMPNKAAAPSSIPEPPSIPKDETPEQARKRKKAALQKAR